MKKMEAVHSEDFDLAMGIKEIYDSLKIMGNDLIVLEAKKKEAIECEDFGAAKMINVEMQRLQLICSQVDPHNPFEPNTE
jgi:uncharacterized protein (UPF0335 family)